MTMGVVSTVMAVVAWLRGSDRSGDCKNGKENKGTVTNHLQGRSSILAKAIDGILREQR
ncbi:hypothetical protein [Terriglobus sp. ADX1]|uniref:hypothetical protein n=1 Tax=Terriglobus sp. ADX1 TaxID=2794063 RepID=UPI002FE58A09